MLEVNGLTKNFGGRTVVDGLTFRLSQGRLLAVLGPNGAGKTTTVRLLLGLLRPTTGGARIGPWVLGRDDEIIRRKVGSTGEYPGLYPRMTLYDYLTFYGSLYKIPRRLLPGRIRQYLELMGLDKESDKKLGVFSKGMQQRAALCRALIHEPPVLFLDEPTSGLDPGSAHDVREYLRLLRREEKRTILLCTHNLEEADQLADEVIILDRGKIVAKDTPARLKAAHGHARRFELLTPSGGKRIRAVAESVPGIMEVTWEPEQGRLEFTSSGADDNSALLRALLAEGVLVQSLSELEHSLEEVYLRLTREGEQT